MDSINTATCTKCKETKTVDQFQKTKDNKMKQCKQCSSHYEKYVRDPISIMLKASKYRAKKKNLEFSLSREHITIPEYCPVLGIKLEKNRGGGAPTDNSPSLDRFDNSRGYTPDNIRIISYKANTIKGSATEEELQKVLNYVRTPKQKTEKEATATDDDTLNISIGTGAIITLGLFLFVLCMF